MTSHNKGSGFWAMLFTPASDNNAIKCAFYAFLFGIPISTLCALCYQFPIPMGGMISGVKAVQYFYLPPLGWVFYMLFGGFIPLSVIGFTTGAIIANKFANNEKKKNKFLKIAGLVIATFGVVSLAVFVTRAGDIIVFLANCGSRIGGILFK